MEELELYKRKTINDSYELAEELGRINFIGWCKAMKQCEYVSSNSDKFGEYDVKILWRNKPGLVEIKFRDKYSSTDYDEWMMECSKLDNLKRNNEAFKIYYYNLFADYNFAFWDITDFVPSYTFKKMLPKNNFTDEKVEKEVFLLLNNKAITSK